MKCRIVIQCDYGRNAVNSDMSWDGLYTALAKRNLNASIYRLSILRSSCTIMNYGRIYMTDIESLY